MNPETKPQKKTPKMNAQEIIANASNITVINDGQFRYPVLTSDLKAWTGVNGEITTANYETFCDAVECIGEKIGTPGSSKMVELCEQLVEAGADFVTLG